MKLFSSKDIGDIGEQQAAKFLRKQGYRILEKKRHQSHNELDIIACDHNYLVFVEVKTRCLSAFFDELNAPSAAVTMAKRNRLLVAARAYMRMHPTTKQPRMDVIEIWLDDSYAVSKIEHIRNAFGAK